MSSSISWLIYCLVAVFGSASWLSTNAIWMQLPLMTSVLPEHWNLPSYLATIVQLACIGPIMYSIVRCFNSNREHRAVLILILLVISCACMLLLAIFWQTTIQIAGEQHSVALFGLMFILALVNLTSNVLFMPYMSTFHATYLTAYFVGMGLSALLPSVVSSIQGTSRYNCTKLDDNSTRATAIYLPRFDVCTFYTIMFVWMIIATISFVLLHWTRFGSSTNEQQPSKVDERSPLNSIDEQMIIIAPSSKTAPLRRYILLLLLTAWVCAQMNGIIPSIQSFANLPYGIMTYHLALILANIVSPIVCLLPMCIHTRSIILFSILTFISTIFTAYIVILAILSPEPPLQNSTIGSALSIMSAVFASGFHSYLRTSMASALHDGAGDSERRLFWCGIFTQIGSFIGAMIMFPLVNVMNLFESAPICV